MNAAEHGIDVPADHFVDCGDDTDFIHGDALSVRKENGREDQRQSDSSREMNIEQGHQRNDGDELLSAGKAAQDEHAEY